MMHVEQGNLRIPLGEHTDMVNPEINGKVWIGVHQRLAKLWVDGHKAESCWTRWVTGTGLNSRRVVVVGKRRL